MIRVFSIVCSCAGEDGATAAFSDMTAKTLAKHAENMDETIKYECITADTVDVRFCRSCNHCFTYGICPLDDMDDMPSIKEKFVSSDVIFFCTPAYMGTMSGFAKCLIDRMAYFSHRFEFAGKTAAVLVTASNNSGDKTVDDTKKMVQLLGATVAYAGCAYRHSGSPNIHLEEQMEPELDEIADRLLESIENPTKYIEPWQERGFIKRNQINRQAVSVAEITGNHVWSETQVCMERGHNNYKTLSEYVESIRATAIVP